MSLSLYETGGLRFWNEREILVRNQATELLFLSLSYALSGINSAWTFHRIEGPILTPRAYISSAYNDDDIFVLSQPVGGKLSALRAETTASSYLYAQYLLKNGKARLPFVVWQSGKSFRRETNDGARASELRFNEFHQCEFQCIYSENTKADYRSAVQTAISKEISSITRSGDVRIVESDRLPSYSTLTNDIEVLYNGKWKEMCSISTRTDFDNAVVLEVAVGLDRLVSVEGNCQP